MENLQNAFAEMNWLAVLVAVVANQVIGGIWYSPKVFGNTWGQLVGIDFEKIDKSEGNKAIMKSVVIGIIVAILLGLLIYNTDSVNPLDGLLYGSLMAVFGSLQSATNNLFEQRPSKLYWINAGYPLIAYSVMGLIIGSWA